MRLEFDVQGIPAPKGSTRTFMGKNTGRTHVTGDNPNTKPWQQAVRYEAYQASRGGRGLTSEPIGFGVVFRFPRPKGHYRKNGELRPSAPAEHTVKPDLDKLLRAMFDALTGLLFVDDSQVCRMGACEKRYARPGEAPGASVTVCGVGAVPAGGAP